MDRINSVLKILLLICSLFAYTAKSQNSVVLTVGDFEISPSGDAVLTIESDVVLKDYCSFQFDLILPEGVEIPYNLNPDEEEMQFGSFDEEEEEWIPAIESGITKSSHTLACNAIDGGYRFVCYHPKFTVFKSGSKNVLTLHLKAKENVVNGVYRPTLGGTMFIANSDEHIVPEIIPGTAIIKGSGNSATYEFTLSESKWGTLMLPFDADIPLGVVAYDCVDVDGDVLILSECKTLYANTPYLLNGIPRTYSFTGIPLVDKNEYSSGCLTGVHSETTIYNGYVLQNLEGVLAFYKINSLKPVAVSGGHCYLNVNNEAQYITINRETGIDETHSSTYQSEIYNINGVRLESTDGTGIYIINNKKKYIK